MRRTAVACALIAAVSAHDRIVAADETQPTMEDVLKEVRSLRDRVEDLERERAADKARIHELETSREPPATRPEAPPPAPPLPEATIPTSATDLTLALPPETAGGQGNLFNPAITVFGDMGYWYSSSDADPLFNRFNVREMELDLRAAITPFADGALVLAIGQEPVVDGLDVSVEFEFEVEEAYINFHTLPFDLASKGGKFRNAFGINNLLHTHDLPQVTRPLAVIAFLGPEGLSTIGANLSWLVPNPWDKYLEVSADLFDARDGVESPVLTGANARNLGVMSHVKYSDDFGDYGFYEVGGSYLYAAAGGGPDTAGINMFGLDAALKWPDPKAPDRRSLLLQGEWFWSSNPVVDSPFGMFNSSGFGFYTFGQYQFARDWYTGVRFDYTEFPGAQLRAPGDSDWGISAYLTWYMTEFLRLRLEYQHIESSIAGVWEPQDNVLFQVTFVFGAHPPHPYWVNR
jgi:hypothetical protein